MAENIYLLSQKCSLNNNKINENCNSKLLNNKHFLNVKAQSNLPELWRNPIPGRHIYAANSNDKIEFGSTEYFLYCSVGGFLSCGTTHTILTPLDLVKCRLQVNKAKYQSITNGFKVTIREEGMRGLARGWAPTLLGYSFQGFYKFGCYEYFKVYYSKMMSDENAYKYRTLLYLASAASAEFIADVFLCPFEAMKVKIQTTDYAHNMRQCFSKMMSDQGPSILFKGLVPLWCRQIPYTMMKFASFERTVELLYQKVVKKAPEDCTKNERLIVTFAGGYIAGVFCAVVSHPADVLVSKLNQSADASIGCVIKKLGFFGMWGGLVPRIIMIGTLTAMQWFIYDAFKVMNQMPSPPTKH